MEDAEDDGKQNHGEEVTDKPLTVKDNVEDAEKKSDAGEEVTEEPVPDEGKKDVKQETEEKAVDKNKNEGGDVDAGDELSDVKNEDTENRPLPSTGPEDTIKAAKTASAEAESSSLSKSNENPSVQESDVKEDPPSKVGDEEPKDGKVEETIQSNKEASSVEKVESEEVPASKDELKKDESAKPTENQQVVEEATAGKQVASS